MASGAGDSGEAGSGGAGCLTVAFWNEPGCDSEAAIAELLGGRNAGGGAGAVLSVRPVSFASLEEAFSAASNHAVDLLMVPVENSLMGATHATWDLMLQHSLCVVAEQNLRVQRCIAGSRGAQISELRTVFGQPLSIALCEASLRRHGITAEAVSDMSAAQAKLAASGWSKGAAVLCSALEASRAGLEVLEEELEDDPSNFSRFLLLRSVPTRLAHGAPYKTSLCFTLENTTGALFRALSVFALRDIDLAKIESRPCKPDTMARLHRLSASSAAADTQASTSWTVSEGEPPEKRQRFGPSSSSSGGAHYRYSYLFYVDFLASADEPRAASALRHLQEITAFFRVLGSYPRAGAQVDLRRLCVETAALSGHGEQQRKKVGIIGFGTFGQFLAKKLAGEFAVFATSRGDYTATAAEMGVAWCTTLEDLLSQGLDTLLVSVSILSFEGQLRRVVAAMEKLGAGAQRMLVVDVCSVKVHARDTMLRLLPPTCDVLCTHPMFGPDSAKHGWGGLPFVFERVRLLDAPRCEHFLRWWAKQGCRMVDMSCEFHDECAAGSQFVTHFTGRVLSRLGLKPTQTSTKGFESLLRLVDNTCRDSFDLFYALYKFNPHSSDQLNSIEVALGDLSAQLREGNSNGAAGSGR